MAAKQYKGRLERLAAETPSHDDVARSSDLDRRTFTSYTEADYLEALAQIKPLANVPMREPGNKHMVIPDTQQKPGADNRHMRWLGKYAVTQKPNTIILMGDHWDMPSLSSWDPPGRVSSENGRYWLDIWAGNVALDLFMAELYAYWNSEVAGVLEEGDPAAWWPRLVLLLGNHENRIMRWLAAQPHLAGLIGYGHFNAKAHGWEVHDFLDVVEIDGIKYSHFFPRGPNGKITQQRRGASNARLQIMREMSSCTAGHQQGLDTHIQHHGTGTARGMIAGACYLHREGYMDRGEGNIHWRGCLIKHEVRDGNYDLMEVSLDYLRRKYGD